MAALFFERVRFSKSLLAIIYEGDENPLPTSTANCADRIHDASSLRCTGCGTPLTYLGQSLPMYECSSCGSDWYVYQGELKIIEEG